MNFRSFEGLPMSLPFIRSVGRLKTSRVEGDRGKAGNYHGKEDWDRIAHWKIIKIAGKYFDVTGTPFFGFSFGWHRSQYSPYNAHDWTKS